MRHALILHPTLTCPPVTAITVDIARPTHTSLTLRYALTGDIAALRIPPLAAAARQDDLWKHTCFEAFLRPVGGESYAEFNLSPSSRWAAYRFDRFREGMVDAPMAVPPIITVRATADSLVLEAAIDLSGAPDLVGDVVLAISTVVETAEGALSYWAVAHRPRRPDFHHPDGFVVALPAKGPQ